MHGLSSSELLELWERGSQSTAITRGLLMLSYSLPGKSWNELAAVSIGRRDCLLLELRRATLGPTLDAFAVCPTCSDELEFSLNTQELGLNAEAEELARERRFKQDSLTVTCHLPDSDDLEAASGCAGVEEAQKTLVSRCIHLIEAENGETLTEIPSAVEEQFSAYLAERDPAAEISLALECPSCGIQWEMALDIVSFFWREIQSAARRIVLEVDALARSYGWAETAILSMSPARRQMYLEMVG
jgi:hypothetical protein